MESSDGFSVVEIIRETFGIVYNNPKILLPQILLVIFYYIPSIVPYIMGMNDEYIDISKIFLTFNRYVLLSVFSTIFYLFFLIISPIFDAMYPLFIKNIVDGKEVNLKSIFLATWKRFWSIWWASILVLFTVMIGLILLIIPGIIFFAWYFYTIPAMMLGDLGASDAMSTSKDFAKNKKLKTILLYLIPLLIGSIGTIISYYFDKIPALSYTVDFGFSLFGYIWMATIPAYAYIKYAHKPPLQQDKTEITRSNEITRTMQEA